MDKKLGKAARLATAGGGSSGYWVEVNLSCCVFCLIGGKVTFSSYLKDYLAEVIILAPTTAEMRPLAPKEYPCSSRNILAVCEGKVLVGVQSGATPVRRCVEWVSLWASLRKFEHCLSC
jgi:hypothetical protein